MARKVCWNKFHHSQLMLTSFTQTYYPDRSTVQNLSEGKTNNTRSFWPLWTAAERAGAPTPRWGADHSCRCRGTWQRSESPPSSSTSTCCCWGLAMEQVQQQLKGLQPSHHPKVSATHINTCNAGRCNVLPRFEWQTMISQSACTNKTHNSFNCQLYLTVKNRFLLANSQSLKGPGWWCIGERENLLVNFSNI